MTDQIAINNLRTRLEPLVQFFERVGTLDAAQCAEARTLLEQLVDAGDDLLEVTGEAFCDAVRFSRQLPQFSPGQRAYVIVDALGGVKHEPRDLVCGDTTVLTASATHVTLRNGMRFRRVGGELRRGTDFCLWVAPAYAPNANMPFEATPLPPTEAGAPRETIVTLNPNTPHAVRSAYRDKADALRYVTTLLYDEKSFSVHTERA